MGPNSLRGAQRICRSGPEFRAAIMGQERVRMASRCQRSGRGSISSGITADFNSLHRENTVGSAFGWNSACLSRKVCQPAASQRFLAFSVISTTHRVRPPTYGIHNSLYLYGKFPLSKKGPCQLHPQGSIQGEQVTELPRTLENTAVSLHNL